MVTSLTPSHAQTLAASPSMTSNPMLPQPAIFSPLRPSREVEYRCWSFRNIASRATDRLAVLAKELRRVGAEVEELADGLRIIPQRLHGAVIETYNDHRMAMSMALLGLKVPGIIINDPGCVAKTYPDFFDDLERL